MMASVAVIIPAAGSGRRLGGVAKPFLDVLGEPVLLHALRPFLADPRVHAIIIALGHDDVLSPPDWLATLDPRITLVEGGAERGDSVRSALRAVPPEADVVLVHDAARPLVSSALVGRAIDAAAAGRAVVAAVPATDTVQRVDSDLRITETPDRASLWLAQTPQAFPREQFLEACERAARDGFRATDDAALVLHNGGAVHVIEGERENLKITVAVDLIVVEALLRARGQEPR
jgi:2-C-methyl-D-erythritol 4-phosphate cytidylyltransferase